MEDPNEKPENYKTTHKNILKKRVKKTAVKRPVVTRPVVAKNNTTRYPALSLISKIYAIFAWLFLSVSILGIFYELVTGSFTGLFHLLTIVITCGLIFITLLAISEAIRVFIDIEENTRARS